MAELFGAFVVVSYLGVLSYLIAITLIRWNTKQRRKLKLIKGDKK